MLRPVSSFTLVAVAAISSGNSQILILSPSPIVTSLISRSSSRISVRIPVIFFQAGSCVLCATMSFGHFIPNRTSLISVTVSDPVSAPFFAPISVPVPVCAAEFPSACRPKLFSDPLLLPSGAAPNGAAFSFFPPKSGSVPQISLHASQMASAMTIVTIGAMSVGIFGRSRRLI